METSVIVNVMITYDKSTREGRYYEWLCKILIHDSSRRFLYPILSKSKRAHPFSHCEQTSTVLPLRRKMQFFPEISRVTFFDRIGHRPGKYDRSEIVYAANRTKIGNQFWLWIDFIVRERMKVFPFILRRRYEYPLFFFRTGLSQAVCHYMYTVPFAKEITDLVAL